MELRTELEHAGAKAKGLRDERADVQNRLREAVEAADVDSIVRLERRAAELDTEIFAADARLLRLQIEDAGRRRAETMAERDRQEILLRAATASYAEAIKVADDRRVVMQTLQAKLFGLDGQIESDRQEAVDLRASLRDLVNNRLRGGRYGLEGNES